VRIAKDSLDPNACLSILGRVRDEELRLARGFRECRGLSTEQLEDLYQQTALALVGRTHRNDAHLRNALRKGLKNRSLNLARDESRRRAILVDAASDLDAVARARTAEETPEALALARHDRLVVKEFLAELTRAEQQIFVCMADGMKYNRIAKVRKMPVNEARNRCGAIEKKRERFQLLYDTGRLCGYRAGSIQALVSGAVASREVAERALAHLEMCRRCQVEHNANADRLRAEFQALAALLLPVPSVLAPWNPVRRMRRPVLRSVVRKRAASLMAGSAGTKLVGGAVVIALLAGAAVIRPAAPTRQLTVRSAAPARRRFVPMVVRQQLGQRGTRMPIEHRQTPGTARAPTERRARRAQRAVPNVSPPPKVVIAARAASTRGRSGVHSGAAPGYVRGPVAVPEAARGAFSP
jgi:DNA-directed RNA polymerase specialized sigma24 family protein